MPIRPPSMDSDTEGAGAPHEIVQRWFAAESGKDFPLIPRDWPDEHWSVLVEMYPEMRYWVAHQPYAPEAVVRALVHADDSRVRARVARKRNLPPDLFPLLASDPEIEVRMAVASNAKAPLELVESLSLDASPDVSRQATRSLDRRHGQSVSAGRTPT